MKQSCYNFGILIPSSPLKTFVLNVFRVWCVSFELRVIPFQGLNDHSLSNASYMFFYISLSKNLH
jgi:hypothetical protein